METKSKFGTVEALLRTINSHSNLNANFKQYTDYSVLGTSPMMSLLTLKQREI